MISRSPEETWRDPPKPCILADEEVHTWRIKRNASGKDHEQWRRIPSPDERQQAARLGSTPRGRHFVTDRAALREILSRYLGHGSGHVRFQYGPLGKPALDEAGCDIHFSLYHSSELALAP